MPHSPRALHESQSSADKPTQRWGLGAWTDTLESGLVQSSTAVVLLLLAIM